jgi:hypothetical protein
MQRLFFFLEAANMMAARDLPSITPSIVGHLKGLPTDDHRALEMFLASARHLRATAREARAWKMSADLITDAKFGDIPLLVLSGQKNSLRRWSEYQKELAALSTRSEHVRFTDMSHLSMLANREHALRVCEAISKFVAGLTR